MKIPIDIISGFLGAGKTTLLNSMLKNIYSEMNIAIVENEFGDVDIDSSLLPENISIKELRSGCACCTIRIDFIKGLKELIKMDMFDRIVIEPSGVAKLSDMLSIINSESLCSVAKKGVAITVVNPFFHSKYSGVVGAYYLNQIENADVIYFSRTGEFPLESLSDIVADIRLLNDAQIFSSLPGNILDLSKSKQKESMSYKAHHSHVHSHKGENAHVVFSSRTISFEKIVLKENISAIIDKILEETEGDVLRIKGSLTCEDGSVIVQWVPGELKTEKTPNAKNLLVVISSNS